MQTQPLSLGRQMRVILGSYLNRPAFHWTFAVLLAGVALGYSLYGLSTLASHQHHTAFASSDTMLLGNLFTFLLVLSGVAGVLITFFMHARQQLMGPIARLLPQGRRANLYVAGALLVGLSAFLAWLPPSADPHSYFGGFLLILTLINFIALAVCRPMLIPLPIALIVLAFMWKPFGQVLDMIERTAPPFQVYTSAYMAQTYELRIIATLNNVLALIVIAAVARPSASQPERVKKKASLSTTKLSQRPITHPPKQFDTPELKPHRFIESAFSRMLHRRIAAHDWRAAGVTAIAMALLAAFAALWLRSDSAGSLLTGMLAFLPGGLVAIAWRDRWPNFDYESLYPVTRRQFINDSAAGLLLEVAEFWIATTGATLLTLMCFQAAVLHEPRFWAALLAGGMFQWLWVGAIFFIGQRRQTTTFVLGLAPFMMAMLLTLESHWRGFEPARPLTTICAALIQMIVGMTIFLMTWAHLQRTVKPSGGGGAVQCA